MPGCTKGWCEPGSRRNWGCAWAGNQLSYMLKQQDEVRARGGYNEVVLDAEAWTAHLPDTVLAFFTLPQSNAGYRARSIEVHQRFLAEQHRSADQVPLLLYDIKRCACYERTSGCHCEGPFSML